MMEYRIERRKRRTLALEVTYNLEIVVKAPNRSTLKEIQDFVDSNRPWIRTMTSKIQAQREAFRARGYSLDPLTKEEIQVLKQEAEVEFKNLVEKWGVILGVQKGQQLSFFSFLNPKHKEVKSIKISNPKTKWGSCDSRGIIHFNCLLMLAPPEVRDYVTVHELCHLIFLDHSKDFWNQVAKMMPEYKRPQKWLKENGSLLLSRLP